MKDKNIYGSKLIPLPAPHFIVFYNGEKDQPDYKRLCLSEAYMTKEEEVYLELKVDMLNVNRGHNRELMEACKTLRDYSEYVHKVRTYAKEIPIEQAVDKAIEECIREDILREFLKKNKAEARTMSIYEYDYEEHMRMEREEWFEDGLQAGREAERENTERERQRADIAESRVNEEKNRADAAEAELARLWEEIMRLRSKG